MNRPVDLGPMGEAAPVKGVKRRPNILVVVWWLFVTVTTILVVLEVTL